MHPSEMLRGTASKDLDGKRIVLGVTGSIAAIESFGLARELVRHGAHVQAVLTPDAAKLVTPWALEFATGNPVIEVIDSRVQHVALLGDVPDHADLLLIAPCTANTISKIASGIDDTPVTTMASTALGSNIPVMVAPAMHLTMYQNPFVAKNLKALESEGVEIVGPRVEGGKAKIAEMEEIVARVIRRIGRRDYLGKKVLVIGGASEEPIDDVRVITNRSTGETAVLLAKAAFRRGAEIELWMGRSSVQVPSYITTRRFSSVDELIALSQEASHDLIIVPAALGDYATTKVEGKIPSGREELVLRLRPLPKVLKALRPKARTLIGFKAEHAAEREHLLSRASSRLKEIPLDLIVANDLRDVLPGETKAIILDAEGVRMEFKGSKRELADRILDEARMLGRRA
ncbi:MAG: bifunctional phosphopantothenoylcysteine decarboxylase/phosphopantothenate--cysteine ligase CoaBC [Methanomassiliicoccales archaeon]